MDESGIYDFKEIQWFLVLHFHSDIYIYIGFFSFSFLKMVITNLFAAQLVL